MRIGFMRAMAVFVMTMFVIVLVGVLVMVVMIVVAMAFMVAGAVSSIPAMAAVWSLVRRDVFASYLGLGLVGAMVSGILFQLIV